MVGDGGGCAGGQEWTACVREALLCSDLGTETEVNSSCSPGCQCPQGFALQVCKSCAEYLKYCFIPVSLHNHFVCCSGWEVCVFAFVPL